MPVPDRSAQCALSDGAALFSVTRSSVRTSTPDPASGGRLASQDLNLIENLLFLAMSRIPAKYLFHTNSLRPTPRSRFGFQESA
jgi:hypothetical protein